MSAAWKTFDQTTRHFHGEARFADPARTRDRNQAHILTQQKFFGGSYFPFPPYKPSSLHRKIRRAGLHLLKWPLREAVANGCEFPCQIPGRNVALIGLFRQAPIEIGRASCR